jgi:Xaa-Pro aminopeptidase
MNPIQPVAEKRIQNLVSVLKDGGLDCAAVIPGANFYYLTGIHFHLMERPTVLFVSADGSLHAVMPELEKGKWQAEGPECETVYWQDSDGFADAFDKVARSMHARKIGVEGQLMRVFESHALQTAFPNITITDAHQAISSIRLLKDETEIALLQRAITISESALQRTIDGVLPGMSEKEIANRLKSLMLEEGADGFFFDPIVLSGGMAADPHGTPSEERKLSPGDAVLIDFGAAYGGYSADITRTFFCKSVSDGHQEIYEAVLAANARGRELASDKIDAGTLDDRVTDVLRQSPFADMILHKTGHGLGLDVHEAPQIMTGNDAMLEPGMVFTIEPGLYNEPGMVFTIEPGLYKAGEIGVRIEDDVVIETGGSRSLSSFPRELTLIG